MITDSINITKRCDRTQDIYLSGTNKIPIDKIMTKKKIMTAEILKTKKNAAQPLTKKVV